MYPSISVYLYPCGACPQQKRTCSKISSNIPWVRCQPKKNGTEKSYRSDMIRNPDWYPRFLLDCLLFIEKKDLVELVLQNSSGGGGGQETFSRPQPRQQQQQNGPTGVPHSRSWVDDSIRVSDQVNNVLHPLLTVTFFLNLIPFGFIFFILFLGSDSGSGPLRYRYRY